jgi:hypothetical protein
MIQKPTKASKDEIQITFRLHHQYSIKYDVILF